MCKLSLIFIAVAEDKSVIYIFVFDVAEEKTEPVKAEAPVKAPVEDTEVSDDRMSEIDKLLKELEDKK